MTSSTAAVAGVTMATERHCIPAAEGSQTHCQQLSDVTSSLSSLSLSLSHALQKRFQQILFLLDSVS